MPEWFTEEDRWALIRRYGLDGDKTPEQMAIDEACELSSEVRELWATRDKWSRHSDDFSRLLWPRVFRAIGVTGDTPAAEPETPSLPESPLKKRVREPDKLETETVDECAAKLRERAAIRAAGGQVSHELTLEGIGEMVDFDRERVRQIEQLMKLGWPLQKRHPDSSAEDGFVRLPSVDKAASALGLSDAEKAARLAKKSLPLT